MNRHIFAVLATAVALYSSAYAERPNQYPNAMDFVLSTESLFAACSSRFPNQQSVFSEARDILKRVGPSRYDAITKSEEYAKQMPQIESAFLGLTEDQANRACESLRNIYKHPPKSVIFRDCTECPSSRTQ